MVGGSASVLNNENAGIPIFFGLILSALNLADLSSALQGGRRRGYKCTSPFQKKFL